MILSVLALQQESESLTAADMEMGSGSALVPGFQDQNLVGETLTKKGSSPLPAFGCSTRTRHSHSHKNFSSGRNQQPHSGVYIRDPVNDTNTRDT